MSKGASLKEQLRRNAVALISLVVALTGLAYNTWRNEASEHNRNQRLVSIELLVLLGDVQQVVLDAGYGKETDRGDSLRKGWGLVMTVRDISMVADGGVPGTAAELFTAWQEYSPMLRSADTRDEAQKALQIAIDAVRHNTQDVLRGLD